MGLKARRQAVQIESLPRRGINHFARFWWWIKNLLGLSSILFLFTGNGQADIRIRTLQNAPADSVGSAQIIDSTVTLSDINQSNFDTRYVTTGTVQNINANKTFSSSITITNDSFSVGTDTIAVLAGQVRISTPSFLTGSSNPNGSRLSIGGSDTTAGIAAISIASGNGIDLFKLGDNDAIFTFEGGLRIALDNDGDQGLSPAFSIQRNGTDDIFTITENNGAVRVSFGTASTPVYSFLTDTNNGIFRAAADNLGFTTNGVERARIDDDGDMGIGTSPSYRLHVSSGAGESGNIVVFSTGSSLLFRFEGDGQAFSGTSFNNGGADIAEMYLAESNLESGDVVFISDVNKVALKGKTLLGVVSTLPGSILGWDINKAEMPDSKPIALAGRTPVKISLENGPIELGDYLTPSLTLPGYAMKAVQTGRVLGIALESFDETQSKDQILCFVNPHTWVNLEDYTKLIRQVKDLHQRISRLENKD